VPSDGEVVGEGYVGRKGGDARASKGGGVEKVEGKDLPRGLKTYYYMCVCVCTCVGVCVCV